MFVVVLVVCRCLLFSFNVCCLFLVGWVLAVFVCFCAFYMFCFVFFPFDTCFVLLDGYSLCMLL